MGILDLFWVFLVISFLSPLLSQWRLGRARVRLIRQIEKERGSRLITLIHRQESISFLGIPLTRYIDVDDSEAVLRAIRLTDPGVPIDLVVHTPGGLVLAAEQIAQALLRHRGKVTVFVPHYAMSGGTLIALAADAIVLDRNAVLGPVDPQVGGLPAVSILSVLGRKPPAEIEDQTLILADVARKALTQVQKTLVEILTGNGLPPEKAADIAAALGTGQWTHDFPISFEEARELGLPVADALPDSVHRLMELFPQRTQRRPSVEYVPVPYSPEPSPAPARQEHARIGRGT
jgi:ClpP class serine protease